MGMQKLGEHDTCCSFPFCPTASVSFDKCHSAKTWLFVFFFFC